MVWGSNTRQVSSAADRLEGFVRSNRSRSKDAPAERLIVSMTASNVAPDDSELLLLPSSSDPATPPSATSITRQRKAVSSPGVFLPRSLSQLEETVRVASSWALHATPPPLPHSPCCRSPRLPPPSCSATLKLTCLSWMTRWAALTATTRCSRSVQNVTFL